LAIEKEEVTVPTHKELKLKFYICELCKITTRDYQQWPPASNYEINETEVSLSTGYSYPGDFSRRSTVLDICPKCFKEKLIPWFRSLGGTPREEE